MFCLCSYLKKHNDLNTRILNLVFHIKKKSYADGIRLQGVEKYKCIKLYNQKIRYVILTKLAYSSDKVKDDVIGGYVRCMEEKRNTYKIVEGKG